MAKAEIVVIGASSGGIQALRELVAGLPANLPAAVLVAVHTSPDHPGYLARILQRSGPLPAAEARDREPIRPGRILVAPPDRHLIVEDRRVLLDRGPRVNNFRPAVDPLFLSAARFHGPRTIGVVLSGGLDDGSFGLAEIKRAGGYAIVQDPEEALVRGMPESAIRAAAVDWVLPAAAIARVIARRAGKSMEKRSPGRSDGRSRRKESTAEGRKESMAGPVEGAIEMFICPECGGALREMMPRNSGRFECHVGHAYGGGTLLEEQVRSVEGALWSAIRALEENAELCRRLARRYRARDLVALAEGHEKKAAEAERRAGKIRAITGNLPGVEGTAPGGARQGEPVRGNRRRGRRKEKQGS